MPNPPGPDSSCGNGVVDAMEKCDLGISEGELGACPLVCAAPACRAAAISGKGCSIECKLQDVDCRGGDGCCPSACSAKDDADCSGKCGDGIVQEDLGETCETGAESSSCPSGDDCDDEDACTVDALSGSAENCNAICTHTPTTELKGGDTCCPAGANANTDSDCMPRCGNGVREGDEACDGSSNCLEGCQLATPPEEMCTTTIAQGECASCLCANCSEELAACTDEGCSAVQACAIERRCEGDACFCGTASFAACSVNANGRCKTVIEEAAGTTRATQIQTIGDDPDSALGRSQAVGACRRAQCSRECS